MELSNKGQPLDGPTQGNIFAIASFLELQEK